jgi:hypothetical protein
MNKASLLPLRGRPNIQTQVFTSLMGGAPPLILVPLQVLLYIQSPYLRVPPPDQTICWCLGGITSLLSAAWGMHPSVKGGEKKITVSKSQTSRPEML